MFSLLLYASHSPKKVSFAYSHKCGYISKWFIHLQEVCLCLSHKSTVALVDKLGFEHDKSVIDWKNEIFEGLLQVTACLHVTVWCYITYVHASELSYIV